MSTINLTAKKRTDFSKRYRNELRREGNVPGVFYANNVGPINISVNEIELRPLIYTAETHLIELQVEGEETLSCIIKDFQLDPVTDKIMHFDLLGLTKGQKLQLEIPISFKGAAVGIKAGGVIQHALHKLNVECLPKDIPESLVVDVSGLNIGDAIHVSDLSFENILILNPEDAVVASVVPPRIEKNEAEEEGEEPTEPEVISKSKDKDEEESE